MGQLDITQDVAQVAAAAVDIESVSGREATLADAVQQALNQVRHLEVVRSGNTVVARTELGRAERVVLAGHLDTVPAAGNLPSKRTQDRLYGLGACDMKGGVAVALRLAATVSEPRRDVTYIFYDCEEVEAERNGLGRLAQASEQLLTADFAVLLEPSNARVEAGCQGTLRVEATTQGRRAHSARSWMGENAIHAAHDILERLVAYQPREPWIDGLHFREGLNAVGIQGGIAGNVIPDECRVTVNYRFSPDRSEDEAYEHVRALFAGFEVERIDSAPGALPELRGPAAAEFCAAVGGEVAPKFGWTDVSRFAQLGVPAVNYGPGDSLLAHTRDEYVELGQLRECEARLRTWLAHPPKDSACAGCSGPDRP